MRPVNLLPPRYQRARATGQRAGIGYAAIGVLAVLLLMVVLYIVTATGLNDAHDKTAKANAEQQAAEARVGQLQAYGDFASMKASREAAVKGVAEARFDYERLMREVALVLPHKTYLTNFAATTSGGSAAAAGAAPTTPTDATSTGSGPSLTLSGCAPSHEGVATAVVRLRQLHNVTDVNLSNSTKNGTAGSTGGSSGSSGGAGCKVAFSATLSFQPEAPQTTQQPVPARLGGGQ